MKLTEVVYDKHLRFSARKNHYVLYDENRMRAVLCKDGYLWCLEPEVHETDHLKKAIRLFMPLINKDDLISVLFAKSVVTEGNEYERFCINASGRNFYV